MKKRWIYDDSADSNAIASLANSLNITSVLSQILVQRGVTTFEQAKDFFRPQLSDLHDPFLMKDMQKAVDRIHLAIENKDKILVYGDYDVDGTTAVALMYSFLKKFTSQLEFYIPDRHKEGYGISTQGIEYAHEQGFQLIIALDCGIKSLDKVALARQYGIDFIICDHHLPGDEIPQALAVLDPKQKDCSYPFKELCGCGVGFKLIQAYSMQYQLPENDYLTYLDLVMVAIGADIVPLVGENRTLAHFGLLKINKDPQLGLAQLMKNAGKESNYTITDVVFILAPRINAAGRIGHAKNAVHLLLADEMSEAADVSFDMSRKNEERKSIEKTIISEALDLTQKESENEHKKTTVLFNENWHKGVVGIVASKLIEHYYYRPTIILTLSEGKITGSARSVLDFDLYEALLPCADLLLQFGGHKAAAGLSLLPENLEAFKQKFEASVASRITDEMLIPKIFIDAQVHFIDLFDKFYRIKQQMAPFGPLNLDPIFASLNVEMVGAPRIVGENHLKISLKQDNSAIFDAIAFNFGKLEPQIRSNQKFDICYHLEQNTYRDKTTLQLRITDMILKP